MLASTTWLNARGSQFQAGSGRAGCIPLAHYSVNYCEWGNGPPLVLIPGLAGGYELLGPLVRLLARDYRVISYRLRGEDDCFALRRHFDLVDLVDDLAELLNVLRLERPALMGVSFGGVLGLEFAARYPHRLQQLIVQGAGSRFERGLLHQVAGLVLSRFPLPTDSPFVNQFFNLLFGGKQEKGPLFEFVTRQCWRTDQSVMSHRFHLVESFDIRPRLGRIRVPTLILCGDRDLLVSSKSLNSLCAGLADPTLVWLAGGGHLAFVTHARRIADEVGSFLQTPQLC